jgi:DNA-binding PadR family transcriptional regulator
LLLSEEPGYGYHLTKGLQQLRFGRVDRPSVYRALAQLERDGLVESWEGTPKAGQARRLYALTQEGQRALRAWMGVIKQERDSLDLVLRRYVATGTIDAVLAEAEGGWSAVTGHPWSPVASTSRLERRHVGLGATRSARRSDRAGSAVVPQVPGGLVSTFRVVPERSAVLIEARSSVGPITFGAVGITGTIDAEVRDGGVAPGRAPSAHLEIEVTGLRSGNGLYDAELLRRIDARRHPRVTLDLRGCTPVATPGEAASARYHVAGDISFHGSTRPIEGSVGVVLTAENRLVASGEQVFDIRDFDIASPTVLMLRIYPDVVVQLQVEAELDDGGREPAAASGEG